MDDYAVLINNFGERLKQNRNLVDLIGDCPNIERPIAPETIFWKKVAEEGGYECQENLIFGNCRIVSPHNTIIANGSRNAMIEKMNRIASNDFFKRGDVIGVSRNGLYEHYGIYLGNGSVIHYCGEGNDFGGKVTVHEAPFSEFMKESKHCFVVWFDAGRPARLQQSTTFLLDGVNPYYENAIFGKKYSVFSVEDTISRAMERLGEEKYNLITNNCEHFAMWCKTGESVSCQVNQIVGFAVARGLKGFYNVL